MPTYDYRCKSCEHRFEHFQGMNDPVLRKCPECGRRTLERLIGPGAGIVFKGSGFYQTDYRSESYRSGAKADSGDGGKKDGAELDSSKPKKTSPSSGSDTKPKTSS